MRRQSAGELLNTHPDRVLEQAVRGMLPKNRLSRQVIKKLKIYSGPNHPHVAQQPQPFPAFV
jgi:large subunit ribosomal protein L13